MKLRKKILNDGNRLLLMKRFNKYQGRLFYRILGCESCEFKYSDRGESSHFHLINLNALQCILYNEEILVMFQKKITQEQVKNTD